MSGLWVSLLKDGPIGRGLLALVCCSGPGQPPKKPNPAKKTSFKDKVGGKATRGTAAEVLKLITQRQTGSGSSRTVAS